MAYWLMKAEPDSRVVKGKDVKVRVGSYPDHSRHRLAQFSVDDFEASRTTAWEGCSFFSNTYDKIC
jgi:predicted RNA-binding protein with PUA-like domain